MGKLQIRVVADECETCIMDYPINSTIVIRNNKNGLAKSFELYTEGPRLEFGLNNEENELVISCPGFSSTFISLDNLNELDIEYDSLEKNLNKFKISRIISKEKKLIILNREKAPDKNWD